MTKSCKICGREIQPERVEALPDTDTCIEHSGTQKMMGFAFSRFAKGTASELAMVDPNDKEAMRRAQRAFRRNR